jgi:hypothetical protein
MTIEQVYEIAETTFREIQRADETRLIADLRGRGVSEAEIRGVVEIGRELWEESIAAAMVDVEDLLKAMTAPPSMH